MPFPKDFLLNQAADIVEHAGGVDKTAMEIFMELSDYIYNSVLQGAGNISIGSRNAFITLQQKLAGDTRYVFTDTRVISSKTFETGQKLTEKLTQISKAGEKPGSPLFETITSIVEYPQSANSKKHITTYERTRMRSDPDSTKQYHLQYSIQHDTAQTTEEKGTPVGIWLDFGDDVCSLGLNFLINEYALRTSGIEITYYDVDGEKREPTKKDIEDFLQTLDLG